MRNQDRFFAANLANGAHFGAGQALRPPYPDLGVVARGRPADCTADPTADLPPSHKQPAELAIATRRAPNPPVTVQELDS